MVNSARTPRSRCFFSHIPLEPRWLSRREGTKRTPRRSRPCWPRCAWGNPSRSRSRPVQIGSPSSRVGYHQRSSRQHFKQFTHRRSQRHGPPQRFFDVQHGHVIERHAGRMVEHDAWQHDLFAQVARWQLRCSAGVTAGLTDHLWPVQELLAFPAGQRSDRRGGGAHRRKKARASVSSRHKSPLDSANAYIGHIGRGKLHKSGGRT